MGHGVARLDNTTGVPDSSLSETIADGPRAPGGRPTRRQRTATAFRPPEPISRSGQTLLLCLGIIAATAGYQGSLPTVVMTYVADQFGATDPQQNTALALIRLDIFFTLVLVRAADRVGRRKMLLGCATAGPLLTAVCALSTSLASFTVLQVISRSFVTAVAILITVMVVEEMPARSRAWAGGCMVACAAIGSGVVQGGSAVADRSAGAWRLPFLVPLLSLPALLFIRRHLSETGRFRRHADAELADAALRLPTMAAFAKHRRRLLTVALLVGLIAFQSNPSRQLRNDYLRSQRGFTGNELSLFGILTNAPGVFGVVFGSLVGDRRSRRIVISVGLLCIGIADFGVYRSHGSAIWAWSIFGALFGAAALPALAILTAELVPTAIRSTANGFTTFASRWFGFVGLLAAAYLANHVAGGDEGAVVSVFSFSLVLAVILLWLTTPETSRRELEELNPVDGSPPGPHPAATPSGDETPARA